MEEGILKRSRIFLKKNILLSVLTFPKQSVLKQSIFSSFSDGQTYKLKNKVYRSHTTDDIHKLEAQFVEIILLRRDIPN